MNSTTTARFVPAGSQLYAELSRLLRSGMGYTIQGAADILAHVDAHGTAVDSCAATEDVAAINALLARHFASMEFEDDAWPDIYSEDIWGLTPAEPANAPLPSEAYLPPDLEPDFADRAYWAELNDREQRLDHAVDRLEVEGRALELVTAGLDAFPAPVCGGSPDERPIRVRPWDDQTGVRSRPQPLLRDEDHQAAGHAV